MRQGLRTRMFYRKMLTAGHIKAELRRRLERVRAQLDGIQGPAIDTDTEWLRCQAQHDTLLEIIRYIDPQFKEGP